MSTERFVGISLGLCIVVCGVVLLTERDEPKVEAETTKFCPCAGESGQ